MSSTVHETGEVQKKREPAVETPQHRPRCNGAAEQRAQGPRAEAANNDRGDNVQREEDDDDDRGGGFIGSIGRFAENVGDRIADRAQDVHRQHKTEWKSVDDVSSNLKKNPDLSTYSKDQLTTLHALGQKDSRLQGQVREAVINHVKSADSLGDLPKDPAFQAMMTEHVLTDNRNPAEKIKDMLPFGGPSKDPGTQARSHLRGLVTSDVRENFDARLDGKEGQGGLESGLDDWMNDLESSKERNPALGGMFAQEATSLYESDDSRKRYEDIERADDNLLTSAYKGWGDAVRGGGGWVADRISDLGELPGGPMLMGGVPLPAGISDDIRGGLAEGAAGMVRGGAEGLADPIGTAKGLGELAYHGMSVAGPTAPAQIWAQSLLTGKDPAEVAQGHAEYFERAGEAFTADYKKTADKHGVVGAGTHVAFDVVTTLGTGGTTAAVKGAGKALRITKLDDAADAARVTRAVPDRPDLPGAPEWVPDLIVAYRGIPDHHKSLIKEAGKRPENAQDDQERNQLP
jgi:hypothetical protein